MVHFCKQTKRKSTDGGLLSSGKKINNQSSRPSPCSPQADEYICTGPKEAYRTEQTFPTVKLSGSSHTVRDAFSWHALVPLNHLEGEVNANKHKVLLSHYTHPMVHLGHPSRV